MRRSITRKRWGQAFYIVLGNHCVGRLPEEDGVSFQHSTGQSSRWSNGSAERRSYACTQNIFKGMTKIFSYQYHVHKDRTINNMRFKDIHKLRKKKLLHGMIPFFVMNFRVASKDRYREKLKKVTKWYIRVLQWTKSFRKILSFRI